MTLVIRNTSRYPTAEVRQLVDYALSELDSCGVCVNVKNCTRGARRGRAYPRVPRISNAPPGSRYLITLGIGRPEQFPFEDGSYVRRGGEWVKRRGGQWPEMTLHNWQEALVSVAAHEGKHIEQFRTRARRSELACQQFAADMLRQYRSLDAKALA